MTADGSERRGRFVPSRPPSTRPWRRRRACGTWSSTATPGRTCPGGTDATSTGRPCSRAAIPARAPASVDSEHPLMVAYTSGTTGRPKGAVHVHGGFLAKIAQEVWFQADLREGDALHWATDMGWIMGPWETVGTHAAGRRWCSTTGRPTSPTPGGCGASRPTTARVLGVSPTLIRALQAPRRRARARARPLAPARLRLDRRALEPRAVALAASRRSAAAAARSSTSSGGTEIGACCSSRCRSCRSSPARWAARRWAWTSRSSTPTGSPVRGAVGELVCTRPWPAMTRGIWNDPERYLATYWSRWPGVWVHGDWASIDAGRPVVPARALRRHAQGRRQAHRAGGVRVGARRASGRRRGRRDRRPARASRARRPGATCCWRRASSRATSCAPSSRRAVEAPRQGLPPRPHRVRPRAPAHPLGQDRAPRRARGRRSARTPATCRRWRTPPPSRPCGGG